MFELNRPTWLPQKPKFNFITLHYLFIVGFCIIGSILLYPIKNMAYIDALFFASGASTQSGLNTIDLNRLKTYQQIVITLISWCTNPVVINTGVVFIRLYWFEKRFDTIVEQSKQKRSMSRRKSDSEGVDGAERGVGGRTITVLPGSGRKTNRDGADENTTNGNKDLQEFRRSVANGSMPHRPISFPTFRTHGRSKSDANHRLALQQSKPGGIFSDGHNDHEFAVEDEEEEHPRPPVSPLPILSEALSDIPERPGEPSTPAHISFADPKVKPRRKDSEVYVVPTPFDVETHGSGLAHKVVSDDDDEEGKGPKDEEPPSSSMDTHPGLVRRAITIDEPAMTHGSAHTGPRPRIKSVVRGYTDPAYLHTPVSPGIHRVFSDVIRRRRNSSPSRSVKIADMPYISFQPTIGRNSQFNLQELTDEEKEELGGVEYRSLLLLAYILVGYFLFFQVFGILCLLPWIHTQMKWAVVVDNAGQNRTWWAIFTASSAFTDLGFTLTPDSMVSFNTATWPLLAMAYLIIVGNTGFPCMLRFIIWALWKICPKNWIAKESLHFLLDHPRRCFTLLFPSAATWWLFAILVILNATDVLLFIVLDLTNRDVVSLPVNYRILDAFFQAVSTRTAGFAAVNLADLHPAVQVSYLIMMYISVFPIAISVRKTNVYEERSLGIYANNEETDDPNDHSFLGAHLRKQLSFDLWYVFLGLFAICIAESGKIANRGDYAFTQFSILFEVVSAYGTVGLSLGYPDTNTSFSAQFTTFSKIVVMAMMIRGRHRGLPYELDRAILLPSESLQQKEEEDAALSMQMRADTIDRRSIRPISRHTTFENANGNGKLEKADGPESVGFTSGFQPPNTA
ncbi:hypothetical protein Dda_4111 [Drechslerella dactyloides]|uniref:Potassium transport protein n=1 Tax=Drechslerella dactyloides TaxID=74499 RepID=A0AAD6IZL7_DREDA|nr:hypothetical protein Dda_4111 [Drechslerella dactyloides]